MTYTGNPGSFQQLMFNPVSQAAAACVPQNQITMDKRVRINKVMVGWSNGKEVHLPPSVHRLVDDYGKMRHDYWRNIEEGYEIEMGSCTTVREECLCHEHEADHSWEQGRHLEALNEMMHAAMYVLPDESAGFEFEDAQWLNPEETLYWHPNIQEFLRYNRRCIDYCKRDPRLWPAYRGSDIELSYRKYLSTLGRWAHDTHNNTYRNCW